MTQKVLKWPYFHCGSFLKRKILEIEQRVESNKYQK